MEFTSVVGVAIIVAVLSVILREVKKEYALVLAICGSVVILLWAIDFFVPALTQLSALLDATNLDDGYSDILIKVLGISILTQLAGDCCRDAGEGAIATKIEMASRLTIVVLSLPLFEEILSIVASMFLL